jgi:hypothetical protein
MVPLRASVGVPERLALSNVIADRHPEPKLLRRSLKCLLVGGLRVSRRGGETKKGCTTHVHHDTDQLSESAILEPIVAW